ncbi:MAG TPA: rRNA maturation RNase YbeY [Candidatus Sulfopaludibacter sp.]|nr:rRNA maturation RNase YbeY [Candidatus Sulfopaludibacter sp.]
MKVEDAGLGIHLVAAPEIIRLNEKFLGHQGTTDVITFDYAEFRRRTSDVRRRLHGEIFICMDEAVWQARKFRTSWQSEIVRYLAHGVLHLIGYDDAHAGERREMKRAENRLLRQISRRFSLAQLARRAKLCA